MKYTETPTLFNGKAWRLKEGLSPEEETEVVTSFIKDNYEEDYILLVRSSDHIISFPVACESCEYVDAITEIKKQFGEGRIEQIRAVPYCDGYEITMRLKDDCVKTPCAYAYTDGEINLVYGPDDLLIAVNDIYKETHKPRILEENHHVWLLIAASDEGIAVERYQSKEEAHKEMRAYIHDAEKSDFGIDDMSGWVIGKYDIEYRIYEV